MSSVLRHIVLIFCLSAPTFTYSQMSYTNRAILYYQENQYEMAMKYIDSALTNTKEMNESYTFYVKGMIYKDHYKAFETSNINSHSRIVAIDAFKTCIQKDVKMEHTNNSSINIKFLAGTFYNDMVRNLDTVNYLKAEPLYEKYKETMRIIDPNANFKKTDKEVYLFMGAQISRKFDYKKAASTQQYFDLAIKTFERVLEIDSTDCNGHYQIAQLYYNYGVEIILSLEDTTPLEQVIDAQTRCADLFQKSLPHMKKALQLATCKSKRELLVALMGIYYELNETDKYNEINTQLLQIKDKE